MRPTILLLTLLTGLLACAALPATAAGDVTRRNIAFIVRGADKVKNIAAHFHVSPRELKAHNLRLRKNQMVYPGKRLVIPVWLERKADARQSDFSMMDYALAKDSVDAYVGEDFINTADIEADTVRREAIDRELRKLDRRLYAQYVSLDSVTRVENAAYSDLSMRDQKKLMIARMRNNPHASINAAIDDLLKQKAVLQGEKNTINGRISDYENLVENASYAAAHPEEAQTATFHLNEWGDDPGKAADVHAGDKSKK